MIKKQLQHVWTALAFSAAIILFVASATPKQATSKLIVPDYDFSPPTPAEPGSAKIKIAFFQPVYVNNPGYSFAYSNTSPFKQFRNAMSTDFEELLSARGYVIKGPYDSYDNMTYSDKTQCELGLFVELALNISQTSGGWKTNVGVYTKGNQQYKGTLNLNGKINIYVVETFTKQKLIIRSVNVPQNDFNVESEGKYEIDYVGGAMGTTRIPFDDPGIHNPIANALSDFYKTTMNQAWDLLEVSELKQIQPQVPIIRKEAGFLKQ